METNAPLLSSRRGPQKIADQPGNHLNSQPATVQPYETTGNWSDEWERGDVYKAIYFEQIRSDAHCFSYRNIQPRDP